MYTTFSLASRAVTDDRWITVTLRLAPVLPTAVAIVSFPDVRKASDAVVELLNRGAGLRTLPLAICNSIRC